MTESCSDNREGISTVYLEYCTKQRYLAHLYRVQSYLATLAEQRMTESRKPSEQTRDRHLQSRCIGPDCSPRCYVRVSGGR